ncbi:MAG: hypothetical protein LBQ43_04250 [Holosporales bacterium]|jgi:hypothetical protein|nr:hypothetical protein [Holosporales bacterium]
MKKMLLVAALSSCVCGFSAQLSTKVDFPVISNQKTDLLQYFSDFRRYFDELIGSGYFSRGAITAGMSEKYFGHRNASLDNSIEQMRRLAAAVREGDLYKQVAKFVGRIEVGEGREETGSGTLVCWDGMPNELKGRVVITCGHNHPYWDIGTSNRSQEGETIEAVATPLQTTERKFSGVYLLDGLVKIASDEENYKGNEFVIHFTPDMDHTKFDVWAPGSINSSIEVERCYFFGKPKYIEDFAVFILKRPVTDSGGTIVDGVNLGNIITSQAYPRLDQGKFFIGYGGVLFPDDDTPFTHPFVGWNLKKRVTNAEWFHSGGGIYLTGGHSFGPSDSGSPAVAECNKCQYMIVGICTGGAEYDLASQRNRLNAVIQYEQGNVPAALVVVDHP